MKTINGIIHAFDGETGMLKKYALYVINLSYRRYTGH